MNLSNSDIKLIYEKKQHKAQTSKNISFHLLKSRRLESWNKRNQSKSFSSNQKRCLSYMLWFILCQYFETRRATPLVSRLFTQVKLPQTQVTLATCVEERNVSRQEKINFFCTAPSTWQPFNFHVHKCSCSMALAQRRADYDKIRSHTYCNCCFLLFDTLCQVSGPERGLKMPLWVLLIFKRVEWLLTSPDAVKSPWPHTKMLHCYCWQYCWHTVLKLDNDFFHVEKRNHGRSY